MSKSSIFRLEHRDDHVAILWMDDPDDTVNTLKRELVEEIGPILAAIEDSSDLEVVVLASGKPDSFIAGANLDMLKKTETAQAARALSQLAQQLTNRLADLRPKTVAALHGVCLGGGLELALALNYRVASLDPRTRIGLPEVQLGLLPGGGGTQRLPALVGTEAALDLLLTGRQLSAQRALRIGLVDEVVPKEILIEAAIQLAKARQQAPSTPTETFRKYLSFKALREFALAKNGVGRRLLFQQAQKQTLRKTRGNYPAAARILEVVKLGLADGSEAGLAEEARAFGELVVSPESRQLINIFFASGELKKDRGISGQQVTPRAIEKIGVLGAGLMGAGISYATITKAETPVRLKDKDDPGLGHGLAHVHRLLDQVVKKRMMTPLQGAQTLAKLSGTIDYSGFANVDLVVEAVFESLDLKQQMVRDIEAITGESTIFASNTSAIPIKDIAAVSKRPETIIGMHYFSPVEKMPLLEIIATDATAPWVIATCVEFGKRQGKTVIVVNDGAGFYTSRILGPYMNEAIHLLTEGVAADRIDDALKDFGFPIGPMTLLDEVGMDVGHKVAQTLSAAFGERMSPPAGIEKLIENERYGKKNRRGLYIYGDDKRKAKKVDESVYALLNIEPTNPLADSEISERCALQMINEAAYCLGEEILRSPRDGDIGAVFGLGFPPFRGGPFRYLEQRGIGAVTARLQQLADQHGPRFDPAPLLVEKTKENGRFYAP